MKNTTIKTKSRPAIAGSVFLLLLLGAVLLMLCLGWDEQPSGPIGGELFLSDFENGVEIYVGEGYSATWTGWDDGYESTPHSMWLVSDEAVGEEILNLCGEITQYRQYEKASDNMLGISPDYEAFPRIYLVTDTIAYSIEILNWENYSADAWAHLPIRQERFGEPVLRVFRIDLSSMPEGETPYGFAREFGGTDSVNGEGGAGWYSTLSRQSMDELLSLLQSVGAENAVEAERFG